MTTLINGEAAKLTCSYLYVYIDGVNLKCSSGGKIQFISIFVAIGSQ